jgi:hypothetical protein
MSIFDGLTEIDGKRCHIVCKKQWEKQWRKIKHLPSSDF